MIRHVGHWFLRTLAGLVALFTVGFVVIAVRLTQGPITIDALTPALENALNGMGGDLVVHVGETSLTWGGVDHPLQFVASRFRIENKSGGLVAYVPSMAVSFSVPALVRGVVMPSHMTLEGPRVHIIRRLDGTVHFDMVDGATVTGADSATNSTPNSTASLFDTILLAFSDTQEGRFLRAIGLEKGTLFVEDKPMGVTWQASDVNIEIQRYDSGLDGVLSLNLALPSAAAKVAARVNWIKADHEIFVDTTFVDIPLNDLATVVPSAAVLGGVKGNLSGRLMTTLNEKGAPIQGTLTLSLPKADMVMPDFFPQPWTLTKGVARLNLDHEGKQARLEALSFEADGAKVGLSAQVQQDGKNPVDVRLKASLSQVPTNLLGTLWPLNVAKNPRKWVTENLSEGQVESASADVHLTFPADTLTPAKLEDLSGDINFSGATVRYFGALPPVTGVAGRATFSPLVFAIDIKGGVLGDLAVGASQVTISDFDKKDESIVIQVPISGKLRSILQVLSSQPLGYPQKLGLDPALASGTATVDTTFAFPLLKDLSIDAVKIHAKATAKNVSIQKAVADRDVTQGDLSLDITQDRMLVSGKAALADVPLTLEWDEQFSSKAAYGTKMVAKGHVTPQDLEKFGVPVQDYITGAMPVTVTYLTKKGKGTLDAQLDLSSTRLVVDDFGIDRPAGPQAKANVLLLLEGQSLKKIDPLLVNIGGYTAQGVLDFGPKAQFQKLTVTSLTGNDTDLNAVITQPADRSYRVVLNGKSLDISSALSATDPKGDPLSAAPLGEKKEKDKTKSPTLDMSMNIQTVRTQADKALKNVTAEGLRAKGLWDRLDVIAQAGDKGTLTLRYHPDQKSKTQELRLQMSDTGAVLSALDLTDKMRGGALSLYGSAALSDPERAVRGRIEATDFVVVKAPVLARLVNALSIQGLSELLQGEGLRFDRMITEFLWNDKGMTLAQGRTSGGALGLTFEGTLTPSFSQAALQGTIVPLAGINRVLNAIPLLGTLLTGGDGKGVFAATYHIKGALSDPEVSVNPLAALAPGLLRTLLFEEEKTKMPPPQ